ncbi:MAG: hypothetical protein LBS81_00695 [Endomicrobium sp.]|jgi:hypothetical protein|nr:hypothetical protein [Endomicrobium sp.]
MSIKKQQELADLVKNQDADSCIEFLDANNDFDNAYLGKFNVGAYAACSLAKSLQKIRLCPNKIILLRFGKSSIIYLGSNLIAGVKDRANVFKYWLNQFVKEFTFSKRRMCVSRFYDYEP